MSLFDDDLPKLKGEASEIEGGEASRVKAVDKRIINGGSDLNQLVPIKYQWAWQAYLDGTSNRWMPAEVELTYDKVTWQSGKLHEQDVKAIKAYVASLYRLDALANDNHMVNIYRQVTAPECRQYYLCQQFERAIHAQCAGHVEEQLGMSDLDRYGHVIDAGDVTMAKWFTPFIGLLADSQFTTAKIEDAQSFLEAFIATMLIRDNVFSAGAFEGAYCVTKQHNLPGIREQIAKIVKDRKQHQEIAYAVVSALISENPDVWTGAFRSRIEQLYHSAMAAAMEMSVESNRHAILYVTNEQLRRLGLPYDRNHPVPQWLSNKKEEHHTEVKQQASTSLEW